MIFRSRHNGLNLKSYTARNTAEALAMVRGDLGADAVILHTRTYRRGGFLGLGAKQVVEITAGEGKQFGRMRQKTAQRERARRLSQRRAGSSGTRQQTAAGRLYEAGSGAGPRTDSAPAAPQAGHASAVREGDSTAVDATAGDLIRRTYAAARAELQSSHSNAPHAAGPAHEQKQVSGGPDPQQLTAEMQAVKRMVAQMMRRQRHRADEPAGSAGMLPDKLADQYLALLQQEVAEELAEEVVAGARSQLDEKQTTDEAVCRTAVGEALAELLPADEDAGRLKPTQDGRPRVIALVGPTGVGKTTTIAKLAATFKLKENKKVGLITLDTYRIAAVDQLRTYAGIIGVPLHVVLGADELVQALEQTRDCDAVLIDTAGRSQRNDQRLAELGRFVEAARPHEVHLVLSSACSQAVLMEAVERFSRVRTDSIIFTKLDEAVSLGVVLNVLRKVNKRLSYITTGQEVPHQIEPGDPGRLAALVMGEARVD